MRRCAQDTLGSATSVQNDGCCCESIGEGFHTLMKLSAIGEGGQKVENHFLKVNGNFVNSVDCGFPDAPCRRRTLYLPYLEPVFAICTDSYQHQLAVETRGLAGRPKHSFALIGPLARVPYLRMGEDCHIASGGGPALQYDVNNERQQQGDGDDQRRHRRFPRQPKPQSVTEETLPRRGEKDAIAKLMTESDVDEAVEMDHRQGTHRLKMILGFVVVAVVISAIIDLACHENIRTWLQVSFDWIEENPEAGESTQ